MFHPIIYQSIKDKLHILQQAREIAPLYDTELRAIEELFFDFQDYREIANRTVEVNLTVVDPIRLDGIIIMLQSQSNVATLAFTDLFEALVLKRHWRFSHSDQRREQGSISYALRKQVAGRLLHLHLRLFFDIEERSCRWVKTGEKLMPIYEFRCEDTDFDKAQNNADQKG